MGDFGEQRSVIQAFRIAVDQSAFVLKENPELTFRQIYNRAQWKEENELLKIKLNTEKKNSKNPG